jgi:hypothetical protein
MRCAGFRVARAAQQAAGELGGARARMARDGIHGRAQRAVLRDDR